MGVTKLQREAHDRAREIGRAIGGQLRVLREDAGLTLTAVAAAAGIDRRFLARIERGQRGASLETLATVLAVLGADLSVKGFPTTGPRIRDRVQAPMVEAFVRALHPRWRATPEVPVWRPARGVIDLVLSNPAESAVIASEFHGELRRLEQQVGWHREKELSLRSAEVWQFASSGQSATATSRLLVLRSTRAMRDLVATYGATLQAAYPARAADAVEALTGTRAWPGAAIVWMRVDGSRAALLDGPPRGLTTGR